jgi:UDP-glucose 4-epimerase
MTQKLRILITGVSGFVGQTTLKYLSNHGHELVALVHKKDLSPELIHVCQDVVKADITDPGITSDIFRNIDVVCHLAAYIPKDYSDFSEAEKCYRVNALGTLNIALKSAENNVKRFIYVSTANMYNFSITPAVEEGPIFPTGIAAQYFVSKLAGEIYLSNICSTSSMEGIILRIGTPYGPGEPKNKLITSLLSRAIRGEDLMIYHGGEPNYNFVYIDDVANFIEKAIKTGDSGIYNISSGESTTLRQVGETIASFFNKKQLRIINSRAPSKMKKGFAPISVEKAFRTWDFQPRTLKTGIHDYLITLLREFDQQ